MASALYCSALIIGLLRPISWGGKMQRKIKHPWSERNTFFLKSSLQRTFLHALQTKIFFPDLLFCPPSSYIFFFAKKCLSCRYCKHWMGRGGEGRRGAEEWNTCNGVWACQIQNFVLPPSFLSSSPPPVPRWKFVGRRKRQSWQKVRWRQDSEWVVECGPFTHINFSAIFFSIIYVLWHKLRAMQVGLFVLFPWPSFFFTVIS